MPAHFAAEHIDLSSARFTPELLRCIPAEMARKFRVLPISQPATQMNMVFAEPSDLKAVDALAQYFDRIIHIYVADGSEVDTFIERHYGTGGRA